MSTFAVDSRIGANKQAPQSPCELPPITRKRLVHFRRRRMRIAFVRGVAITTGLAVLALMIGVAMDSWTIVPAIRWIASSLLLWHVPCRHRTLVPSTATDSVQSVVPRRLPSKRVTNDSGINSCQRSSCQAMDGRANRWCFDSTCKAMWPRSFPRAKYRNYCPGAKSTEAC